MTRTVPVPLAVETMQIQPSFERSNVKGLPEGETEETSSSAETRLFNFFSPEKPTSASAALARPERRLALEANRVAPCRNHESTRMNTNPRRPEIFTHRLTSPGHGRMEPPPKARGNGPRLSAEHQPQRQSEATRGGIIRRLWASTPAVAGPSDSNCLSWSQAP